MYQFVCDNGGVVRTIITSNVLQDGAFEVSAELFAEAAGRVGHVRFANGVLEDLPPEPPALPSSISDRQFFQQLAIDGEISEVEALAAVATGTVPAALAAVIAHLPGEAQFAANMFLQGATTFERNHPMTQALAGLMGWDDAMIAALWTNASAL